MGTLYENILALCQERGIKGGKMCTDIGMSKGILTDLKMGRQTSISMANAQKIASYFGVSVDYLLGEETEKTPILTPKDERNDVNLIKIAGRDGSYTEKRVSDEQLVLIQSMLDQMKPVDDEV